jgi:hypothetical protein
MAREVLFRRIEFDCQPAEAHYRSRPASFRRTKEGATR